MLSLIKNRGAICTALSLMKTKDDKYKTLAIEEHKGLLKRISDLVDINIELDLINQREFKKGYEEGLKAKAKKASI